MNIKSSYINSIIAINHDTMEILEAFPEDKNKFKTIYRNVITAIKADHFYNIPKSVWTIHHTDNNKNIIDTICTL